MSRVAKQPVELPQGVTATITDTSVTLKGAKGSLSVALSGGVKVVQKDKHLELEYDANNRMQAGSTRSHLSNMAVGVSKGYERKLELVGVGYRAAVQGKTLNLTLGYSHPIAVEMPEGISVEAPSQTEIVLKGIDKQRIGQIAAEIRELRAPEPYKGKGVRYAGEQISLKEGKKKDLLPSVVVTLSQEGSSPWSLTSSMMSDLNCGISRIFFCTTFVSRSRGGSGASSLSGTSKSSPKRSTASLSINPRVAASTTSSSVAFTFAFVALELSVAR